MKTNRIPETTLEAYDILDEMLSSEQKMDAVSKSGEEFADEEHFGLGMWIRNNWFYGAETPEQQDQVAQLLSDNGRCYNLYAPDTLSCRFLEQYHEHLLCAVA